MATKTTDTTYDAGSSPCTPEAHLRADFQNQTTKEYIMTITIKTHLNSGIHKSDGGGETRTHYEFSTGPRNLLKAIETLHDHRKSMERGYGNIGCGRSWLEIDGQAIHFYDLDDVMRDDAEAYGDISSGLIKSRTQKARELLAEAKAGYNINKYDY